MRRGTVLVRKLHRWLGLSLGALFVVLGLTGSFLVFYQEIDTLLHPVVRPVASGQAPGWDSPVWDQALATVRTQWPDRLGPWRFEATGEPGAIPARYQPPGAGHHGRRVMVWLTPDGKQVLREAEWGVYVSTWLYDLHMDLLQGPTGRAVVGWAGLAILVLLGAGLWDWWPRGSWRTALHFKRDAVASRRLRDIHKLSGLAALPLLAMLALTGAMLALPDESNAVLATMGAPVTKLSVGRSSPGGAEPMTFTQVLAIAHREMPQGRLGWVEAPAPGTGAFMVRIQQPGDPSFRFPHSYVFVDQYSGQVVARQDRQRFGAGNVVNNWLHPLHDASIGGPWLRGLVALAGLLPLALFVTGWMRWARLRKKSAGARCEPHRVSRRPVGLSQTGLV